MKNYLVINFKTYTKGSGKNAEKLAITADKIAKQTKKNIILVVQDIDINRISKLVSIPVYAQHLDPIEAGAHTGKILAESLKYEGAKGVVINHSEDRVKKNIIKKTRMIAKNHKLKTIICAKNSKEAKELAKFKPEFLAIEPPKLIGGNVSVSTAKPELITETVNKVRSFNNKQKILCGAGVKTAEDVKKAIELGANGVFVASGVVKAKNPKKEILELVKFL